MAYTKQPKPTLVEQKPASKKRIALLKKLGAVRKKIDQQIAKEKKLQHQMSLVRQKITDLFKKEDGIQHKLDHLT